MLSDKEGLEWLENKLKSISPFFYQTETYKLLRDYLSEAGYWRVKSRGNPRKGYQSMKDKLY